jgi:pentapeptide MXKDX repeat protein
MAKRTGWLGRSIVVAAVGVVFGLTGVVGQSVAQTDGMKKDDKMMGDKMKAGDTMMKSDDAMKKGDMKADDMKADDMKKDGKAMMKDEKMMPTDKPMEKKQ